MTDARARLLQASAALPTPPQIAELIEQARDLVDAVQRLQAPDAGLPSAARPYLVAAEKQLLLAGASLMIATLAERDAQPPGPVGPHG